MKVIIASSKTMKEEIEDINNIPLFVDKAQVILRTLKTYNQEQLKKMYGTSDKLTKQYFELLKNSNLTNNLTMAIKAYDGVVFRQFNGDLSSLDINYLDQHLIVLSALYGLLKPSDGIINYRLDMNDDLKINSMNLYDYFGDSLYEQISNEIIINLASQEYSKLISKYANDDKFIDIDFLIDDKHHSTQLKKARGLMVKYMLDRRVEDFNELRCFNYDGYCFNHNLSNQNKWVFVKNA